MPCQDFSKWRFFRHFSRDAKQCQAVRNARTDRRLVSFKHHNRGGLTLGSLKAAVTVNGQSSDAPVPVATVQLEVGQDATHLSANVTTLTINGVGFSTTPQFGPDPTPELEPAGKLRSPPAATWPVRPYPATNSRTCQGRSRDHRIGPAPNAERRNSQA